jgi:hypothetical protein
VVDIGARGFEEGAKGGMGRIQIRSLNLLCYTVSFHEEEMGGQDVHVLDLLPYAARYLLLRMLHVLFSLTSTSTILYFISTILTSGVNAYPL